MNADDFYGALEREEERARAERAAAFGTSLSRGCMLAMSASWRSIASLGRVRSTATVTARAVAVRARAVRAHVHERATVRENGRPEHRAEDRNRAGAAASTPEHDPPFHVADGLACRHATASRSRVIFSTALTIAEWTSRALVSTTPENVSPFVLR